ncbi:MAG: PHD finger domain-containing protein [Planctomycetes bacterium]|nr:PHD finger domain-containing protein [Planctomycetota bacterium]
MPPTSDGPVQLSPRDPRAVRCAYCREALADTAGVTCDGCGTRLHPDCVVEPRCPTLGCPRTLQVQAGGSATPARTSPGAAPSGSALWRGLGLIAGVGMPLACFVMNESFASPPMELVANWQYDRLWSRLSQLRAADAQRPLYPLLAWSMAAYVAHVGGDRRGPWVRVGLRGGVVLAALFSLLYLPTLPAALIGIIAVIGLLGFGPYLALIAFALAALREASEPPATKEEGEQEGPAFVPWALWSALGVTATALVVQRMNERWAALPTEDPNCFVATAAARGHPRLTGAAPVRLAHGRVLPVTRQLRALKAFELALAALLPRGHRALRWAYDRLGPPVARRLSPATATLAWVLLLPAQAAAEVALRLLFRDATRLIDRTYGA